jgi:dTDP-4-amino-4,6-dideoxygalactose transaminase
MRQSFLVFGAPNLDHTEIDGVSEVMKSGWLGTGPKVGLFEREFARFKGAENAAAVNSCTAALHLSILAAGIGPGDEVITSPMTFCSTVNVIIHAGATPVLADIDPVSLNIDPNKVAERLTPRTRAILPVHFAGRPANMDALSEIAKKHNLRVIEDCAHAIETEYHGLKAGTIGDFGCFSFYVTKNIVTGEGGMVIARNRADHDRIKVLSLHGMSRDAWKRFGSDGYRHYQVTEAGFKYNMMDLQAAIGLAQLEKLAPFWERRRQLWERYQQGLAGFPLGLPAEPEPNTRHAYHLYTVLVDETRAGIPRDAFLDGMIAQNIGVGVHYVSIPEHRFYQRTFAWDPDEFPHAARVGRQTVSLPLTSKMTNRDVDDVIEAVALVLKNDRK